MNNLLRFFDYFYLKAQTDVVNNRQRKVGVFPKNATHNHFTAGLHLIFLGGLQKLLILMDTANLFRDPKTKSCDPKWGHDP